MSAGAALIEAAEQLAALVRIATPAPRDALDQLARQHRREWLEQRVRRELPPIVALLERLAGPGERTP